MGSPGATCRVEFVKLAVSHVVRTGADDGGERRNGHGGRSAGAAAPARTRAVWEAGKLREVAVYDRDDLARGAILPGPCVVEETGATTYVPLGWRGAVDANANLVIDRAEETA